LEQVDSWRLQQAAAVLQQLAQELPQSSSSSLSAAVAGAGVLASDAAVFAGLHAIGLVASVLQARPAAVVDFTNSSSSSRSPGADAAAAADAAGCLAESCCAVVTAAVFSLKQRAASPLLPPALLIVLTKTAVSLLLADAQAKLQQQQQQQQAVAVQGLLSLLLSPDAQLRLHSAAALVQACYQSSSSSSSSVDEPASVDEAAAPASASPSSSSSMPAWGCMFEGVACAVLQQQSLTAQQLLPAYQAIAEIATAHSSSGEQQQQGLTQAVVQMIVQQLAQWQEAQQQQQDSTSIWPNTAGSSSTTASLQPLTAERLLLLQLLLGHVLSHSSAEPDAAAGGSAGIASQQVQQVQAALLQLLHMLLPLLQQQEGIDCSSSSSSSSSSSTAGLRHKVSGSSTAQPAPGGWLNYQALLSPSPLLLKWGATQQERSLLFGTASSSSSSSSSNGQGLSWLLDPTLEGLRGCRLMQGLPLQLAAAAVDLVHTLLSHDLKHAVEQHQVQQGQLQAWCSVLCGVIGTKALKPVKKLAKKVLTDLAGGSAGYKQHRAMHHLQRQAAALLQLLGLDVAPSSSAAAAAAAVQLQMSWQQQCAAAALLSQLLAVAESQPSCWARICSSSSSSMAQLLPLLLQVAVHCRAPQLCLSAVKLFNLALTGAGVNPKAGSSTSRSSSSSSGAEASSLPQGKQEHSSSSGSGSQKPSQQAAAGDAAAAKSSSCTPLIDLSWLQLGVPNAAAAAAAAAAPEQLLLSFVSRCVLGWPEPKERKDAAKTLVLLHKTLEGSNPSGQLQLLQLVLSLLPAAGVAAGAASLQLFATAAHLVKATPAAAAAAGMGRGVGSNAELPKDSWQDAIAAAARQLFGTALAAANALTVHPYAAAYQQLQQLLELESIGSSSSSGAAAARHWLELSAADVFAAAAGRPAKRGPSSSSRLANMAAELKFGDRQVRVPVGLTADVLQVAVLAGTCRAVGASVTASFAPFQSWLVRICVRPTPLIQLPIICPLLPAAAPPGDGSAKRLAPRAPRVSAHPQPAQGQVRGCTAALVLRRTPD
jgi:hypothetical protein